MLPLKGNKEMISTHTLTWSVTGSNVCAWYGNKFQLTRSRGAWPAESCNVTTKEEDFNSHAHVERDRAYLNSNRRRKYISTHTLTWSVTCKDDNVKTAGENFNSHAHVERDQAQRYTMAAIKYFNSHAHVERDVSPSLSAGNSYISTHTLTWSVT